MTLKLKPAFAALLLATSLGACVTPAPADPVLAMAQAINRELALGDPPEKIEAFFENRGIAYERMNLTPAYNARIPSGAGDCDIQVLIAVDDQDRFLDSQVQSSCIGVDPSQ